MSKLKKEIQQVLESIKRPQEIIIPSEQITDDLIDSYKRQGLTPYMIDNNEKERVNKLIEVGSENDSVIRDDWNSQPVYFLTKGQAMKALQWSEKLEELVEKLYNQIDDINHRLLPSIMKEKILKNK